MNELSCWLLLTDISKQVILATVAAKGSALSFSMAAFQELEMSIELFKKLTVHPVVKHGLVGLNSRSQVTTR